MNPSRAVEFERITAGKIPTFEAFASGHRACQGCGAVLAMRQALKAMGENTLVVSATGCIEVVTTPYPQSAWNVPWLHVAFENAAAVGSGVEAARKAMIRKERLPANDSKIVIIGGDGATSDIGFQSLSGALERGHNFVYVCIDNEAYMNTGAQRSSATPWGCWTTTSPVSEKSAGKTTTKKDLPAIAVAHKIPYVATASPAYHMDLMNKVRKAMAMPGPAFVHILSPCPTGWKIPAHCSVKLARLAVQTRIYPLYEVTYGRYAFSRKSEKARPVKEYLQLQGRFKHLSEENIAKIQAQVDEEYADLERRTSG